MTSGDHVIVTNAGDDDNEDEEDEVDDDDDVDDVDDEHPFPYTEA